MIDSQYNQDVMNAIGGTSAAPQRSTLSTGTASDMSSGSSGGLPNLPGMPAANMNVQNTMQQFAQTPQMYNPFAPAPYQPIIRHGIGKDNWNSSIGLDQAAILNSLGLGSA